MIKASVASEALIAGRPAVLTVELSNTGAGPCQGVVFKLKLPPGLAHVSGPTRIDLNELRARQVHVEHVTVRPQSIGEVELTTPNFAYRDEDGRKQRHDDWRVLLRVQPPGGRPGQAAATGTRTPPPPPPPPLSVSNGGNKLTPGRWGDLEVVLGNTTGIPLYDVSLELDGPFQLDRAPEPVQLLSADASRRVAVDICFTDEGKIPVTVHSSYRYRDERGQVRLGHQKDRLTVEVADQAPPQAAVPPVSTILYVVAQPRDTALLNTYQEMREVENLLSAGRDRDRYRLKHRPAAQLRDIGQALGDYAPQVVHFAGHGRRDGSLALEDKSGHASFVNPAGLAELLGVYSDSIRCVIVNACYSLTLAEAVVREIDYVVGMRSEILDAASIEFSVGFYQGLFAGRTVPEAFRQGCALVQAEPKTKSQYKVPMLLTRQP
jgi:hypothetical protein